MGYILSIDQSTSGTKGLLFSPDGALKARADLPHRQITDDRGWVEHDPQEILQNTLAVARKVLEESATSPEEVLVVGISNQRETAVCWDAESGRPVYNAIVWQCARATDILADALEKISDGEILRCTGINPSPFFSGAKFGWIVKHVPAARELLEQGKLRCGTVDAWLLYSLSRERSFCTDYSNASRTQLLNLDTLAWDSDVAVAFGLETSCLPEIKHSDSLFGTTDLGGLLPTAVPIHGMLGDSHAALFANGCTTPYTAKCTYGTGSSIMMNAGDTRPGAADGVVTSLAWGMGGKVEYVLEGNINYTGAVTKWLVEDVELLERSRQAGEIAATVPSTNGVYLVPAFSGLGAPYFNNEARAVLCGMNRTTRKAHIVRAAEECIAYQIKDVVEAVNSGIPSPLSVLRVDGGPTRDAFLMQFQSDILGIPLEISQTEELSGAGAAYCAAIGAGLATRDGILAARSCRTVTPSMGEDERAGLYAGWKKAVGDLAAAGKAKE